MPCHMIMARASLRQGDHGCHAMAPHCPPRVASVLLAGLGCAVLDLHSGSPTEVWSSTTGALPCGGRSEDSEDPTCRPSVLQRRFMFVISHPARATIRHCAPSARSRVGSVQSENYLRALKNNYPIPQPHATRRACSVDGNVRLADQSTQSPQAVTRHPACAADTMAHLRCGTRTSSVALAAVCCALGLAALLGSVSVPATSARVPTFLASVSLSQRLSHLLPWPTGRTLGQTAPLASCGAISTCATCAAHTSFADGAATSMCAWCPLTKTCVAATGTALPAGCSPTSGCLRTNASQCPVGGDDCSSRTTCGDCAAAGTACGWCRTSGTCLPASHTTGGTCESHPDFPPCVDTCFASAPLDSVGGGPCTGSPGAAHCSGLTTVSACLAEAPPSIPPAPQSCGWSYTSSECLPMLAGAPCTCPDGDCPSSYGCVGATNCGMCCRFRVAHQPHRLTPCDHDMPRHHTAALLVPPASATNCSSCAALTDCGWCAATSTCLSSKCEASKCPDCLRTTDFMCPAEDVPCGHHTDCSSCAAAGPACGWCRSTEKCIGNSVDNTPCVASDCPATCMAVERYGPADMCVASQCSQHTTLATCVAEGSEIQGCGWCAEKQTCVAVADGEPCDSGACSSCVIMQDCGTFWAPLCCCPPLCSCFGLGFRVMTGWLWQNLSPIARPVRPSRGVGGVLAATLALLASVTRAPAASSACVLATILRSVCPRGKRVLTSAHRTPAPPATARAGGVASPERAYLCLATATRAPSQPTRSLCARRAA